MVVGAYRLDRGEASQRRHRVKQMVIHESYIEQWPRYDIALLQLKTSIEYNHRIKPICVDGTMFSPGSECIVTGWGSTNATGMYGI